jgi:hypothetical protein
MIESELSKGKILSSRIELVEKLKDSTVLKLTRYSWEPPKEVAEDIQDSFNASSSLVFRLTAGALLITLSSGLVLGFGYASSEGSLTIWLEKAKDFEIAQSLSTINDNELYPIDSLDETYSEQLISNLVGQKILSVKILKRDNPRSTRNGPVDAGLILEFQDGLELILALNLSESTDDFAIIFRDEIEPEILDQLQEISI